MHAHAFKMGTYLRKEYQTYLYIYIYILYVPLLLS